APVALGRGPGDGRCAAVASGGHVHNVDLARNFDHAAHGWARLQHEVAGRADFRMLDRVRGRDRSVPALQPGEASAANGDVALGLDGAHAFAAAHDALGNQHGSPLAHNPAAVDRSIHFDVSAGQDLEAGLHVAVDLDVAMVADVAGVQVNVADHDVQLHDVDAIAIPAQKTVDGGRHLQAVGRDDGILPAWVLRVTHRRSWNLLAENVHSRLTRIGRCFSRNDVSGLYGTHVLDVLVVHSAVGAGHGHERWRHPQQLDLGVRASPHRDAVGYHDLRVQGALAHQLQDGDVIQAEHDLAFVSSLISISTSVSVDAMRGISDIVTPNASPPSATRIASRRPVASAISRDDTIIRLP